MRVRDDPATVGVREQQVVVLREEPGRRRDVLRWQFLIREVEQFRAVGSPVGAQLEAAGHLAQPGQAGPGLDVRH
ncbi:MAG TPA: hypothetical protein VFE59_21910, partial [Trebonia sp.]|nr:hypothetical protein [Trebonia sp.]